MLTVKRMKQTDRAYVMPRVKSFYQSDAVTHAVPEKILQRSFEQAVCCIRVTNTPDMRI